MKYMTTIIASIMLFLTGCTTLPTAEQMSTYSTSIGYAAGVAAEICKIDDNVKTTIIDILNDIESVIPTNDQSFADAWTPFVDDIVSKMTTNGKINDTQAKIIKTVVSAAEKGLDYMFNVRWPKAKEYSELVNIGISNFIAGFTSIINPKTEKSVPIIDVNEYKAAIEYLKK